MNNGRTFTNKLSDFFKKLCIKCCYFGIPDLWTEDFKSFLPLSYFHKLLTVLISLFILSQFYSFWTQTNLSEKQKSDRIVFVFSHPILFSHYFVAVYYQKTIKKLLYKLTISLKEDYNDPVVESSVVKKSVFYSILSLFIIAFSLISYGFDGLVQIIQSGNNIIIH